MKRWPWITLSLALLALAIHASPAAQAFLIFDRVAIARAEWWRFFSGHLVHFHASHLFLDLLVFGLAALWVELRNRRLLVFSVGASACAVSAAVMWWEPDLRFYGGLSGVATALVTVVALELCREGNGLRAIGVAALAVLVAKLCLETIFQQPLFAAAASSSIRVVPLAHGAGMLTALGLWLWARTAAFGWFVRSSCGTMPQLE